jgi:hypothetical protein
MACILGYVLLRPALIDLKRRYPEPQPGPAALDDPELAWWLQWATGGGNVPSFVGRVVEAAILAGVECGNAWNKDAANRDWQPQ